MAVALAAAAAATGETCLHFSDPFTSHTLATRSALFLYATERFCRRGGGGATSSSASASDRLIVRDRWLFQWLRAGNAAWRCGEFFGLQRLFHELQKEAQEQPQPSGAARIAARKPAMSVQRLHRAIHECWVALVELEDLKSSDNINFSAEDYNTLFTAFARRMTGLGFGLAPDYGGIASSCGDGRKSRKTSAMEATTRAHVTAARSCAAGSSCTAGRETSKRSEALRCVMCSGATCEEVWWDGSEHILCARCALSPANSTTVWTPLAMATSMGRPSSRIKTPLSARDENKTPAEEEILQPSHGGRVEGAAGETGCNGREDEQKLPTVTSPDGSASSFRKERPASPNVLSSPPQACAAFAAMDLLEIAGLHARKGRRTASPCSPAEDDGVMSPGTLASLSPLLSARQGIKAQIAAARARPVPLQCSPTRFSWGKTEGPDALVVASTEGGDHHHVYVSGMRSPLTTRPCAGTSRERRAPDVGLAVVEPIFAEYEQVGGQTRNRVKEDETSLRARIRLKPPQGGQERGAPAQPLKIWPKKKKGSLWHHWNPTRPQSPPQDQQVEHFWPAAEPGPGRQCASPAGFAEKSHTSINADVQNILLKQTKTVERLQKLANASGGRWRHSEMRGR